MKVTCQSCQAKYTIADEKVRGKVAKIRCKKCGTTIIVNGTDVAAGGVVTMGAASAPMEEQWSVLVADGDQRTANEKFHALSARRPGTAEPRDGAASRRAARSDERGDSDDARRAARSSGDAARDGARDGGR